MTVVVRDEFSAEQTGVKKVTATGSDLTNVTSDYVLKRGSVTIDLDTITLSEDKTSAVIASKASRLTAGEYTLQFKDKDPVTFTVEDGRVTSIDIPNDTLPLDGDYSSARTASIGYKVYNQFNEDITKTVSTVNATSSFGTASASINESKITVTFPATAPLVGTTGTIVIVDTSTGINFSKTLTLGMQAKADSIEVLGVYNSATGEKMEIKENSTNANAALLIKVKDQYGGEMSRLNASTTNNEVAFTFTGGLTNITVATSQDFTDTITVDGETCVIIPLNASSSVKTGTAQAFFVSTSTGKTANATITVGSNATVRSIEVYPMDQVYGGKENEFSYTALTEEGTEVKDYDTLSNAQYGLNSMNSTYGDFTWRKNSDGTAKLIYTTNPSFDSAIAGNVKSVVASATFVTAGYGTKTITFTVYAPSIPTSIGGIKDVTLGLLNVTATESAVTFNPAKNLVIYDQYGNSMSSYDGRYTVKIVPVDATAAADDRIVTKGAVSLANMKLDGTDSIQFAATNGAINAPYSERYTATLLDSQATSATNTDGSIAGSSYTFTVTTAPMSSLTRFTMGTIPALYDYSKDTSYEATHKTEPSVTGYTAANIAISIPNDKLTLTPGRGVSVVTEPAVDLGATAERSFFSASGAASYIQEGNQTTLTSKETNVTVTVDNAAGTTLTQSLNVSTVAPAAKEITAYTAVTASAVTVDTMNTLLGTLTKTVKDQYGKTYNSDKITTNDVNTIQISNMTDGSPSGNKITVSRNNTAQADISDAAAGDSFVITVTLKSGTVITTVVDVE